MNPFTMARFCSSVRPSASSRMISGIRLLQACRRDVGDGSLAYVSVVSSASGMNSMCQPSSGSVQVWCPTPVTSSTRASTPGVAAHLLAVARLHLAPAAERHDDLAARRRVPGREAAWVRSADDHARSRQQLRSETGSIRTHRHRELLHPGRPILHGVDPPDRRRVVRHVALPLSASSCSSRGSIVSESGGGA